MQPVETMLIRGVPPAPARREVAGRVPIGGGASCTHVYYVADVADILQAIFGGCTRTGTASVRTRGSPVATEGPCRASREMHPNHGAGVVVVGARGEGRGGGGRGSPATRLYLYEACVDVAAVPEDNPGVVEGQYIAVPILCGVLSPVGHLHALLNVVHADVFILVHAAHAPIRAQVRQLALQATLQPVEPTWARRVCLAHAWHCAARAGGSNYGPRCCCLCVVGGCPPSSSGGHWGQ